jgi:predicted transglutaminase-like cysteine proteinase
MTSMPITGGKRSARYVPVDASYRRAGHWRSRAVYAAIALALLALLVRADRANGAPMPDGGAVSPPAGFVSFCMHTPEACTNRTTATAPMVVFDSRTEALLVAVNDRVNRAIRYEDDEEHYGVANRWTLTPEDGAGDCKDYALAKREALRAAGLPDQALRIALVRTRDNALHAVLTVDTDKGVLVLDSLTSDIRPWTAAPYRWLTRQSADDPLRWVAVEGEAL